jgi:hypothetical protein
MSGDPRATIVNEKTNLPEVVNSLVAWLGAGVNQNTDLRLFDTVKLTSGKR